MTSALQKTVSTMENTDLAIDRPSKDIIDAFQRTAFSKQVARLVFSESKCRATGIVAGMTGPWGSGKSQSLLYIADELETLVRKAERLSSSRESHPKTVIINFNPWLYSNRDEVLSAFFREVREACQKTEGLEDIVSVFQSWSEWIDKGTKIASVFSPSAARVASAFMSEQPSLDDQKTEITDFFSERNASVVVIIDEIDRLSDEEIRGMAQVIKSIADFPMFSYLLSYDPERVARALGQNDMKLGHYYLEKIVQVQLRLPHVPRDLLVEYALSQVKPMILKAHREQRTDGEFREADLAAQLNRMMRSLVPSILSSPRDARRLAAACHARLPFAGREVDLIDLLAFCALETRVPMLSERLQNYISHVTIDGVRETMRRSSSLPSSPGMIDLILGDFRDDEALRDLLVYLFPALREEGAETVATHDTRLHYSTPLSLLLNYSENHEEIAGLVTWQMAGDAVRAPISKVRGILETSANHGLLRHAVLRFRSALRASQTSNDQVADVWREVGGYFDRGVTEDELAEPMAWLDLTHVFVRGAFRDYFRHHPIDACFVRDLIEDGRVHLPARILEFSAASLGMFSYERSNELRPILTAEEVSELYPIASEAFAEDIEKQYATKSWHLKSVTPIWVVRHGDSEGTRSLRMIEVMSRPEDKHTLDGILILMHRYRDEMLEGQSLAELLDLESLAQQWLYLDRSSDEVGLLLDESYRYFLQKLKNRTCMEASQASSNH